MRTYFSSIIVVLGLFATSCEDVIDLEVQEAPIKLTIEASLDWEKGTLGNEQTIKLSTSKGYFDKNAGTTVTGASVKVTNDSSNEVFVFEDQNNGEYFTSSFKPVVNQSYTLEVVHNSETYVAHETLTQVTDIQDITQSKNNGFDEEDLEVNVIFTDPEEENNYYLFKFQKRGDLLPTLESADDEFVNGNRIRWYHEKNDDADTDKNEAFVPGDLVDINFYGISEQYYNYIKILIEQSEGGGLFSSTPVALKGNCLNANNPSNNAYGYFRLTQMVRADYTFE